MKRGFETSAYASAEALLASADLDEAVCVVADLRLPSMSGLELLGELRRQARRLPMILITAHDTPGGRAAAERLGVAAYLVKPFLGSTLIATVGAVMGATRPR